MIPLNYNQLYYFFKIAELGSISQASKTILISSPALSMQLKELEESLGTPLFSRVANKLVLTEAGTIVFEYAKDIFKLGFELKDTLADRNQGGERPKIEIGCQDSIAKKVADELLAFLIEQKSCKVILREGNRERLFELQNEFKLDIILTNSVPQEDSSSIFESKLICREELVVVGHPKYQSLASQWPSSGAAVPFILPTFDSSCRQKIDVYFKQKNLSIDVVAEVQDKATEIDLALRGLGLVTALLRSVSHLIRGGHLTLIGPLTGVDEEIWMIAGKRKLLNPVALFAINNFKLSLDN
ncbi:MAG TPA: LysR family transcriptional regulator [Bacteriovoracaceae bacterium]|nr:LysR family transcriptional regulator [Bacteriovoracaceae bacterium]